MKICEKKRIGYEFLNEHNWPIALANDRFNKCYCELCYSKQCNDTFQMNNNLYIVPRAWIRFGLHIDPVIARHLDLWNWSTSFHGTSINHANSIIEHRMLLLPGDLTLDGKRVEIPRHHIPGQHFFFTSPTIKYAELYSTKYTYRGKYSIKVAIQCKQKPGTFCSQPKTIASVRNVCSFVSDESLEWKSEHRSSIVPYGLLLLITPTSGEQITEETIDCPKCKVSNGLTLPDKEKSVNLVCLNEECLCKFVVKYCPNCSQLNVCEEGAERKKVFVCSNERCSKRYEQLIARRRK